MSAKTVIGTVVGFLEHHVGDLNAVATGLSEILGTLPIDSQDKTRIGSVIDTLKTSADNITNWLTNNTVIDSSGEVVVKESDIANAIASVLPNLVAKEVEDYLTAHPPITGGNANG